LGAPGLLRPWERSTEVRKSRRRMRSQRRRHTAGRPRMPQQSNEGCHRVVRDRPGKLPVARPRQPRRRAVAMGESFQRIAERQDLVDVVEERGRLSQATVDGDAVGRDPCGSPARDLADGACVRACRSCQSSGAGERSREAASTRPGTVIGSMVPDGRGPPAAGPRPWPCLTARIRASRRWYRALRCPRPWSVVRRR